VIIKETYRDPSQTRLSFPASGTEGPRPYIKESLLRLSADDDDEVIDDDGDTEDWSENDSSTDSDGNVSLATIEEADEDDDSEDE
jgi:hypothetical protein